MSEQMRYSKAQQDYAWELLREMVRNERVVNDHKEEWRRMAQTSSQKRQGGTYYGNR